MSALDWRQKMTVAPRLVHGSDGLVLVQLGEDSVLFPTEADARFFHDAYLDVPCLVNEVAHLRGLIDEKALTAGLEREKALAAEAERLKSALEAAKAQNAELAEKAADAARRARVLAQALRRAVNP